MTYDLLLLSSSSPGTTFTYEQRAGYTVNGILTPFFPHTKHVYKMNSKNTTKQRVYRAQDPITHSLFKVEIYTWGTGKNLLSDLLSALPETARTPLSHLTRRYWINTQELTPIPQPTLSNPALLNYLTPTEHHSTPQDYSSTKTYELTYTTDQRTL